MARGTSSTAGYFPTMLDYCPGGGVVGAEGGEEDEVNWRLGD